MVNNITLFHGAVSRLSGIVNYNIFISINNFAKQIVKLVKNKKFQQYYYFLK